MKGGRTKSKLSSSASYCASSSCVKASEARLSDLSRIQYGRSEPDDSISIEYIQGFGNQDSLVLSVADMDSLSSIDTSLNLTRGSGSFDEKGAITNSPHNHISLSNAETETNSSDRKQPRTVSSTKKKDRWKAKTASKPDK